MKKELPVNKASRLVNPGSVILVTSKYKEKTNIVTIAWQMPVSYSPMMLGVAIATKHLSTELINKSKEFVINIPSHDMIQKVKDCGSISGRESDKFKDFNLTEEVVKELETPGIKECIARVECKVESSYIIGDHTIFAGKVIAADADEDVFDFENMWYNLETDKQLLHHLGGPAYSYTDKDNTIILV